MQTPPLRPRHHPRVEGEVRRTDADLPDDTRQRRLRSAELANELAARKPGAPSLVATAAGSIARLLLTILIYAVIGGQTNPYGAEVVRARRLRPRIRRRARALVVLRDFEQRARARALRRGYS